MTTAHFTAHELAHRSADGLHVTLFWLPSTDGVVVEVHDDRNGESFTVDAPAARALDAFQHPYAYAAFAGLECVRPDADAVGV